MKTRTTPHNLEQLWERGIERATEDTSGTNEISNEKLGETAGLHIKTGISASGLWGTTSCSCQQGCTHMCTAP